MVFVLRFVSSKPRTREKEWWALLWIVQSVISNSPSPQWHNIFSNAAFTCLEPSKAVKKLIWKSTGITCAVEKLNEEHPFEVEKFRKSILDMRDPVQDIRMDNPCRGMQKMSAGELPNFTEKDYVPVIWSTFLPG